MASVETLPRRFCLRIDFAADFADIFEVRGFQRPKRGRHHPAEVGTDAVSLAYTGLDDIRRETRLQFEPAPARIAADHAEFDLLLAPHERKTLFLEVRCGPGYGVRAPRAAFFAGLRAARRALRATASRAAAISSSNEVFNETVRRSVSDLYMLATDTQFVPIPMQAFPGSRPTSGATRSLQSGG